MTEDEQEEAAKWDLGVTAHYVLPVWQEHYGLPQGAYVAAVEPGSPAADAGLQPDDIIVGIGDTAILGGATLKKAKASIPADGSDVLVYWRQGAYYSAELIRPKDSAALK